MILDVRHEENEINSVRNGAMDMVSDVRFVAIYDMWT